VTVPRAVTTIVTTDMVADAPVAALVVAGLPDSGSKVDPYDRQ